MVLDANWLAGALPVEGLGHPLHVHARLESTNATALALAAAQSPHGTLVVAEEQTAGRGRANRRWITPPGAALAFSLILRPRDLPPHELGEMNVLGALAVVEAAAQYDLHAQIKWPNDVLVGGRKVAGVLAETSWSGEQLEYVVLGIGVNVSPASVPREDEVDFPATSLGSAAGRPVARERLLVDIVGSIGRWYRRVGSDELRETWERNLAFLGEQVAITDGKEERRGRELGISRDGRLMLEDDAGQVVCASPGAHHLRPVDSPAR